MTATIPPPPPATLTIEGEVHKITPAQWRALVVAAHREDAVAKLAVVRQLAAKGLCSPPWSWAKYERHEWGRRVATLYHVNLRPGVAEVVRAIVAARQHEGGQ